ncbi:ankyrin repeat domain-containing protein 2B [Trifolium repens]|nr:ankyrin repeat domain-containing protein 2B [Trifolium repens]
MFAIPGSRGENVRWNNFLSALPCPQGLGPLFTEVSKKQIVESTTEEPSLVGFILKLNLVDVLLANVPWNLLKPCPFYWRGYWGVKSTSNVCNQETKPVAAKEALLTILAKVKEEELPVLRFVRELILVLYLYRFLNIMRHQRRNLFNQGDQVARTEALLARERETLAKLCMEFRVR